MRTKKIENINKKGRLLYMLKLLYENTDDQHQMSTNEIIDWFAKRGIPVHRKTVKDDIDTLVNAGYDIETLHTNHSSFYYDDREFEIPELKLLIDAVMASRFITDEKSRKITRKLTKFASKYQSSQLVRHLYPAGRVKPNNEKIFYIVDNITDAINKKQKIRFQYEEYTPDKKKVLRNNGEVYENSPYALFWSNDFYYLIGYSEKHKQIIQFRVDRMVNTEVIKEKAIPEPEGFNAADYGKEVFEMFCGEEITVTLECDNVLMKTVIDKFGEEVETKRSGLDKFRAKVRVAASPVFYGWVFQFGGQIKIVSPVSSKKKYQKMLQDAIEN
jgi:predicted DNA-binding transcriptional regulator YafY